jgi:hypothetical protein
MKYFLFEVKLRRRGPANSFIPIRYAIGIRSTNKFQFTSFLED